MDVGICRWLKKCESEVARIAVKFLKCVANAGHKHIKNHVLVMPSVLLGSWALSSNLMLAAMDPEPPKIKGHL